MNYVEWLRVRNCLRVVVIVLAILVALAVILRISLSRNMSGDAWISHFKEPGTVVTHITLPDGTRRTIWDNPGERTHVVIDDYGYAGKHIVVTEPSSRAHQENDHVNVGSIHVVESHHGALTTTVIDTNGATPMIYYMAVADLMALIVGMVLAAPFAREIEGHLEVALTKPVSRARYALGVIGADCVAILVSSFLTIVALYLCQLLFESGRLDFSGVNARAIAIGVITPLAWYALLCALTTWFHRSYIAVLVAALPVALVIGGLTLLEPSNAVTLVIRDIAWGLSRLNPWTYVQLHNVGMANDTGAPSFGWRMLIQVTFFVVYSALATWRWQRVEA